MGRGGKRRAEGKDGKRGKGDEEEEKKRGGGKKRSWGEKTLKRAFMDEEVLNIKNLNKTDNLNGYCTLPTLKTLFLLLCNGRHMAGWPLLQ